MKTPTPFARVQQVAGLPEHPCETIVRNGALICPYEEMEVRFYAEHAGLYLLTLVGDPFEIFGWGGRHAQASLMDGYLPVIQHDTVQKGCALHQTVFACLLDGEAVVTGEEPLINMVELKATNVTDAALELPVVIIFGSCFHKRTSDDGNRYGCDSETFMGKETGGNFWEEQWWQPCPFTLSMATMRKWLRTRLVYEDDRNNRLVIGKAIPKEWIENAMRHEAPISIEKTASYYGPVSVRYRIDFSGSRVEVSVHLHDPSRFPSEVEVRLPNLGDRPVTGVKLNDAPYNSDDAGKGVVRYCPQRDNPDGRMRIEVEYVLYP